ncbi:MAG: BrnA antitoxin family protein [Pseudomonadota bacterium]
MKPKPIPDLRSDEQAEAFVNDADLTEFDLSGFTPVRFEYQPKEARINMRLPTALLEQVKQRAKARGLPYQRYIREILENAVESK